MIRDEFLAGQVVPWSTRLTQLDGIDVDLTPVEASAEIVPYEGSPEPLDMDPIYRDPANRFIDVAGRWESPSNAAGRYTIRVTSTAPLAASWEYLFFVKQAADVPPLAPIPPEATGISDLDFVEYYEEG